MDERTSALLAAWTAFLDAPSHDDGDDGSAEDRVLALFHRAAEHVPAYREFLTAHGVLAASVRTLDDFREVPCTTKQNYHEQHSLPRLCWDDRKPFGAMLAFSSGSTGEPTVWPRALEDELRMTARFEQVLVGAFEADRRSTLVVVCFALGTWVGGMYTAACCRHLAAKGHLVTVVTPGNNKTEIFRVLDALEGHFEQLVLCGYPPFLKDVITAGTTEGRDWSRTPTHLVMAGEVFSEEWRSLLGQHLHAVPIERRTASLYGTADGGVLANETPLSIQIRRALAVRPELARQLFGETRLPTLCQYDPRHRFFELDDDGHLVITGDHGAPLLRYKIFDRGGIISYSDMMRFLADHGIVTTDEAPKQPFVYVFGRSSFAVSFYGANVFPENIASGLERLEFAQHLTGKFVVGVDHDNHHDAHLVLDVELATPHSDPAAPDLAERVAQAVRRAIEGANSEFSNYVPEERRTPHVRLLPLGDPSVFPVGIKHRYTRS